MNAFLESLWHILLNLGPWLLIGAGVAGLLHIVVPQGTLATRFRGYGGIGRAVLWGVPMPLCSCSVIPAGVGLKQDGASDGSSIAFMVSTPQTGVDSILVSAAFLGWPFALFKVAAAGVTGLAAGALTERFGGPRVELPTPPQASHGDARSPLRRGLEHADELIYSIWGWLVFGILTSAAISTWLPMDALTPLAVGSGAALAGLLMLAVSVPLYVCATASMPLAAAFLHAGLPASAVLVFVMAGPATNVATVGAVKKAFGSRVLAIYLATVIVGSWTLGMLFGPYLPMKAALSHGEHAMGWFELGGAVILGALLLRYAWRDGLHALTPKAEVVPDLTMEVAGITCQGCARRLDRALREVDGVEGVEIDVPTGMLTVSGRVEDARVRDAVAGAGFTPVTTTPSS